MRSLQPEDPRSIGDYTILCRLGVGAMGIVFLAEDANHTPYAIKIMMRGRDDQQYRDRFRHEAKLAQLVQNSPHGKSFIAGFVEADVDCAVPYIVFECVRGVTLNRAIDSTAPFDGQPLISLAYALALAVASLHEVGVVHRDIKPSNIIISPNGVRMIDLGIAHHSSLTALTQPGQIIGTRNTMAPEQFLGGNPQPAWDIYALGAVLYYAATGCYPEPGNPEMSAVPKPIRDFVGQCLQVDPALRPTHKDILTSFVAQMRNTRLPRNTRWLPPAVREMVLASAAPDAYIDVAGDKEVDTALYTLIVTRLDVHGLFWTDTSLGGHTPPPARALPSPINRQRPPRTTPVGRVQETTTRPPASERQQRNRPNPAPQKSIDWKTAIIIAVMIILIVVCLWPRGDGSFHSSNPTPSVTQTALSTTNVPSAASYTFGKFDSAYVTAINRTATISRVVTAGYDLTVHLTISAPTNKSPALSAELAKNVCLWVTNGAESIVTLTGDYLANDPAQKLESEGRLIFHGALQFPGSFALHSSCKLANVTTKLAFSGTNAVDIIGVITSMQRSAAVLKATTDGKQTKVTVYDHIVDPIGKMCMKSGNTPHLPVADKRYNEGDIVYRVLTFDAAPGTLYLECNKDPSHITYVGNGLQL